MEKEIEKYARQQQGSIQKITDGETVEKFGRGTHNECSKNCPRGADSYRYQQPTPGFGNNQDEYRHGEIQGRNEEPNRTT